MDVFYENLRKISEQKMTRFVLLLLLLNLVSLQNATNPNVNTQLGNILYENKARKGKLLVLSRA
jgi:hypothetical protein